MSSQNVAICTIVAKNYFALAKTLYQSVRGCHKNADFYILIVDEIGATADLDVGDARLVPASKVMDRSALLEMAYSYDVTEFSTALKPFFLSYLLGLGHTKAIYFDPDILLLDGLDEILAALDSNNVVITPHLDEPLPLDNLEPSEITILKAGAYNLGFIALSNSQDTRAFLDWWSCHLRKHAANDPKAGTFTDQKWIDLVPCFVPHVHVLASPRYNVAYWNYHGRPLDQTNPTRLANGESIVFFHFSGFDPTQPSRLSKYQTRHVAEPGSSLYRLLKYYAGLAVENGHVARSAQPYGYASFSNGVKVDLFARRALRDAIKRGMSFPNPGDVESKPSFYDWLNEPAEQPIDAAPPYFTNYLATVYEMRADLRSAFPEPYGRDKLAYFNWLGESGRDGIGAAFVSAAKGKVISTDRRLPGVNAIGYFRAESGTGEAGRSLVRALQRLEVPLALLDVSHTTLSRQDDNSVGDTFAVENRYQVNLLLMNADQTPHFAKQTVPGFFENRYSIGEWAWELTEFPSEWEESFAFLDEIWVGSHFEYDAISRRSPIGVFRVPLAVQPGETYGPDKERFGIVPESFCFLFMFDYYSFFERKNPLAVVSAFKEAFNVHDAVNLIIKCINSDCDQASHARLMDEVASDPRIKLMDCYLSKDEKNTLLASCDSYVSLHRCEGFGLTMAEAMYFGKPVIGTGWSGNTDFMKYFNSYLIDYELMRIPSDHGPYKAGQIWANPSISSAAEAMRRVVSNRAEAAERGRQAAMTVRRELSDQAVSQIVQGRLEAIRNILETRGMDKDRSV